MEKQKKVDAYILKHEKWGRELELLRETLLHLGLEEGYKWSAPVYMVQGKNVVGLGAFKNHFGVWFFNGSLLKDDGKKLYNAQEGKTTAMRQWRFNDIDDIAENLEVFEKYIQESIKNSKLKKTVKPNLKKPLILPEELKEVFKTNKGLASSFDSLNLTRKREYVAHLDSAKREATKLDRLKKMIPLIMEGVGLHDKYRKN